MTSSLRRLHAWLRDSRRPQKRLLVLWLAGLLTIGMLGAGSERVGPHPDGHPNSSVALSTFSTSHGALRPIGDSVAPSSRTPHSGADLGAGPSDVAQPSDLLAGRPGPAWTTSTFLTTSGPGHPRQERAPPCRADVI